jgi:hypothetical protein
MFDSIKGSRFMSLQAKFEHILVKIDCFESTWFDLEVPSEQTLYNKSPMKVEISRKARKNLCLSVNAYFDQSDFLRLVSIMVLRH